MPEGAGGSAEKGASVTIYCGTCLQRTNHEVVRELKTERYEAEPYGVTFYDYYQIVRCRGCETVSFRHAWGNDVEEDEETGELLVRSRVYPYRLAGRKAMDGAERLPPKVRQIYEETLTALAADAPILGTAGIRAVIEAVCNDKKASGAKLGEKIDDLVHQGWLSPREAKFFHKTKVPGDVAIHAMRAPNDATLKNAMDIVEHLLRTIYILPEASEKLGKP